MAFLFSIVHELIEKPVIFKITPILQKLLPLCLLPPPIEPIKTRIF
jgi:hypothetical protein